MEKFTLRILPDEIFTAGTPLGEAELMDKSETIGRKHGGKVRLAQVTAYIPVLEKDGD